jgi:alpha-glucosidase
MIKIQTIKFYLCAIFLAVGSASIIGAETYKDIKLSSPDNHISVRVSIINNRLSYLVKASNELVVNTSALGIVVDSVDLGLGAKIVSISKQRLINENYKILGNHQYSYNNAKELSIGLTNKGYSFDLILRVYNDGLGIRYTLPLKAKHIDGESTSWNIPLGSNTISWMDFSQSYEGLSHATSIDSIPTAQTIMGPLTIDEGHHLVSISEADCENFSDMAYVRYRNTFQVCFPFARLGWDIQQTTDENSRILKGFYRNQRVTPWRTIVIANDMTQLVNSDLITNLCPSPSPSADFSWVKPGRCLWHWWSIGAPKYEDQKSWFDAAAKLKWEYYLIDEGWRDWRAEGKDQWTLLKQCIDYGKSVGVKTLVWVDSKEMRKASDRRKYLEKIKSLGASGIKIDFIPDATSQIMQWYMGTMQDCAELKLLLNFHGSVKPTGLSRTYPNNITREAVRGDEYHMSRYRRVMPYDQDVVLPFTRPLAGAADVTPVMLNPQELISARYTWAHEFAQAIVFMSPITHFCDQYKFYQESPMFDLFQELPTVWEETLVLPVTKIGKVVAYARRKGDTWWIGVMNGGDARTINIPLTFLKKLSQASLLYDATATNTSVSRVEKNLLPTDNLVLTMQPGGGFVAKIRYLK